MAVTNTDEEEIVNDDTPVTEDDLRSLKYDENGVETQTEDEPDESTEETEETEDTSEAEDEIGQTEEVPTFEKQFPNIKGDTPEEYAKNLEVAYQNSTAEAMRLKNPPPKPDAVSTDTTEDDKPATDTSDITALYAKQQMDKAITEAWTEFGKQYSQVADPTEYNRFTVVVSQLSNTILQSEKRLADPSELYRKAAVILDWQPEAPSKEDKLNAAVKDSAASSKTSSATKRTTPSKVTDAMISANRKMYPGKSDADIIKELEPYV